MRPHFTLKITAQGAVFQWFHKVYSDALSASLVLNVSCKCFMDCNSWDHELCVSTQAAV